MTMTSSLTGDALALQLEGRLDTITAPQLEAELNKHEGVASLTLDFDQLVYISSAGLRVLLGAQKRLASRGGVHIINVAAPVMEVFEMTGFTTMLDISAKATPHN